MGPEEHDLLVPRFALLRRFNDWAISLLVVASCVGIASLAYPEFAFRNKVVVMNRRMREVGGGFSNERRAYSRHVAALAHEGSVADEHTAIIAAVLRDWQRDGWSPEPSLDQSGTSVGDSGLVALSDVSTLGRSRPGRPW